MRKFPKQPLQVLDVKVNKHMLSVKRLGKSMKIVYRRARLPISGLQ